MLPTHPQAAMGIAHLLVMALEKEGIPKTEAIKKIWMVDSKGLIVKVLFSQKNQRFLGTQSCPELN
jgi:malate dehydrogenase (oxaloacetate-decarboxylating)(NADP+)